MKKTAHKAKTNKAKKHAKEEMVDGIPKGKAKWAIVAAALLCIIIIAGIWAITPKQCQKDTTICQDGTTAYRAQPSCDFQCPKMALREITLSTDKPLYHSGEQMWINLTIASEKTSDANIHVHGINSRTNDYININTRQTLDAGLNAIAFGYTTPACNTCAGLAAGTYTLTADISTGSENSTENTTVEIRQ